MAPALSVWCPCPSHLALSQSVTAPQALHLVLVSPGRLLSPQGRRPVPHPRPQGPSERLVPCTQ